MCHHRPHCPPADAVDREAAQTVVAHPDQGWSLLCNGVVRFDDTGELLPDGGAVPPHRPAGVHREPFPARGASPWAPLPLPRETDRRTRHGRARRTRAARLAVRHR